MDPLDEDLLHNQQLDSSNGLSQSPFSETDGYQPIDSPQQRYGHSLYGSHDNNKVKRRHVKTGYPRPSRYSARAISRQLSSSEFSVSDEVRNHLKPIPETGHEFTTDTLEFMNVFLFKLLHDMNIVPVNEWKDSIIRLVLKVAQNINLNIRIGDDIDVSRYVKVKKVPGGTPYDSECIDGIVFSKSPCHKRMLRPVSSPRIVLISFPIEYKRSDRDYLSLDSTILQEKDYIQNVITKILALKPNVVISECIISRLALDMFLAADVIAVHNVKSTVLEAMARCLRTEIYMSSDRLNGKPYVGMCSKFVVKTFDNALIPNRRKTFIYLEGCPRDLGCSLVLRGGSLQDLVKVKQIVNMMVFMAYNLKVRGITLVAHRNTNHPISFFSLSTISSKMNMQHQYLM
jgi:1-phosphatidylinositol-3-phosphate 5-kinase